MQLRIRLAAIRSDLNVSTVPAGLEAVVEAADERLRELEAALAAAAPADLSSLEADLRKALALGDRTLDSTAVLIGCPHGGSGDLFARAVEAWEVRQPGWPSPADGVLLHAPLWAVPWVVRHFSANGTRGLDVAMVGDADPAAVRALWAPGSDGPFAGLADAVAATTLLTVSD